VLSPEVEPLDVLWQDPTTDPSENLKRLSQIAGAYASARIDKASEIQMLLKVERIKSYFCSNSYIRPVSTRK